jgi:hypothetical protein
MQWKVAKELQRSDGVEWAREWFSGYDLSLVEWITVRRGDWDGYSVKGVCRYPKGVRSGMYRINCSVNARPGWPGYKIQRVSPLYRNPDGSWPEVPEGHVTGAWWEDPETGREWKRMYRKVPLTNENEALVYIVAHEAYHYLRRTKQVPGRNAEIDADAFGMTVLEAFRRGEVHDAGSLVLKREEA